MRMVDPIYRKKKPAVKKLPPYQYSPAGQDIATKIYGPQASANPGDPGGTATDPGAPGAAPPGPDYAALIANDPTLVAFRAALQGQSVSDKAAHDAAIRRAYIQFGGHPNFNALGFGDISGLIDPLTQKLADDATAGKVSTTYRLGATHDTAEAQIRNALAARGLAHSGEAGTQFQHEATAYGQANYDATQKFVDYVGGIKAGLAANERNRQFQLIQAEGDAAARQAQYPWNYPADPADPAAAPAPAPDPGVPGQAPSAPASTGFGGGKLPVKKKAPPKKKPLPRGIGKF